MHRSPIRSLALSLLLGCATTRIANTDVPDTAENRDIVAFCERYRHAVEARDARTLLAMASPRYFEDAGTPDGADDYGVEGLSRLLTLWADEVNEVRYEIRYRRITIPQDNPDRIQVDYTYTGSYTIHRPAGPPPEPTSRSRRATLHLIIDPVRDASAPQGDEVWYRRVADNRLEIERDGDTLRIVSGM